MKRSTLAVALAALCASPMALAQTQARPYVSLMGLYTFPDSTRNLDDGYGGRLLFGIPVTNTFSTEISGFITRADHDIGNGSDYLSGAGLDFVLGATPRRFSPFLLVGGGYHKDEIPGPNEDSAYANAGGGLLWNIGGRFDSSLRLEGRRVAVFNDNLSPGRDHIYDTHVGLGFQMALSPRPEPVPEPLPPPPPPAPEPVVIVVVDSDNDGVPDDRDACPNTMAGIRVDARGCAIEAQVVELRDVNFEFGKATLTADGRSALNGVASSLKGQPTMEIRIEGHTDSVGNDAFNQRLSQSRANSVRDYLISQGIAANRLAAEGFGESRPVASNSTPEGRAMNRRVEMKVNKQ